MLLSTLCQTSVSLIVCFTLLVSLGRSLETEKQFLTFQQKLHSFTWLHQLHYSPQLLQVSTSLKMHLEFDRWPLGAFYQCVLAAAWLTAWVQLPYMNEGRAHLSYQSVNVTASRQKASVSRLKTALCSLRGRTLSQKQTLQAQIVAFCMSSCTGQTAILLQNRNPPLSVRDGFSMSSLTVGMPPENIFSHLEMGCLSC